MSSRKPVVPRTVRATLHETHLEWYFRCQTGYRLCSRIATVHTFTAMKLARSRGRGADKGICIRRSEDCWVRVYREGSNANCETGGRTYWKTVPLSVSSRWLRSVWRKRIARRSLVAAQESGPGIRGGLCRHGRDLFQVSENLGVLAQPSGGTHACFLLTAPPGSDGPGSGGTQWQFGGVSPGLPVAVADYGDS